MSKRVPMGNKLRFEVFKRDSFMCQYCGQSAPDIVLNVDHIIPVVEGGDNEITNLITSCFSCNSGKSGRKLDDKSVIKKQQASLAELNERRLQLEMMAEWREGLKSIEEDKVNMLCEEYTDHTRVLINEEHRKEFKKLLKKYPMSEILDCIEISCRQYLVDEGDWYTQASLKKTFSYIGKICACRKRDADNPDAKKLSYAKGIIRNRYPHWSQNTYSEAIREMTRLCAAGMDVEDLVTFCKIFKGYNELFEGLQEYCKQMGIS